MNDIIFNIILSLNNFIELHFYLSFIIYFLISLIFFTFSLPGGVIISLSSGFFFGVIFGFLINVFSASFGSLIFIILSKSILKKLFQKYYIKYSEKLSSFIKKTSFEYLILIRLLFGTPLIFQNICISILKVSNFKIFTSSIIGFTPYMLLFSYIGSYASNIFELKNINVSEIFSLEIILILLILIFLIILKIFIKK
tara:strand:+ start:141 stop:731 length:591 start_codon:yes stop_codon:yes gene_type:complete